MLDIPNHYRLKEDNNDHFVVHDARKNTSFKVSKKEIHPATQIRIMKMQKFDDGGQAKSMGQPYDFEAENARDVSNDRPSIGQVFQAGLDKIIPGADEPAPPQTSQQSEGQPPSMAQAPQAPAPATTAQPQNVDLSTLAIRQPQQHSASPIGYDPMAELKKAQGLETAGAQKEFEAKSQSSKDQAQLYQDEITHFNSIKAEHDDRMNAMNSRSQALFDAATNGKIDPNSFWNNKSTGSKIASSIGVILGGIGQGLMHSTHNMAMDTLNNAIDRDIDAQKSNMNQKNNLFRMNMDMTHNANEAYMMTKSDMMSLVGANANKIAAQMGTPMAQSELLKFQGNLGMQMAQMHAQFAKAGVERQAYTDGVPPQAVPYLSPQTQKQMVRLPNGSMANSGSEANAKEYNEQTSAYGPLMSDLNELKSLNGVGGLISPSDRARAESLKGHIVISLNDLAKSHRISESDIGFQKGQLSDPTSIMNKMSGDWNAATETLQRSLTNKMDAVGMQYVPAYANTKAKQAKIPFKEAK